MYLPTEFMKGGGPEKINYEVALALEYQEFGVSKIFFEV